MRVTPSDEDQIEVIEVGDDVSVTAPSRAPRAAIPWSLIVTALACAVALASTALVWKMRAERDDARREAELAQFPSSVVIRDQYIGHFISPNDSGLTLVLTRTPQQALIAVAQVFGEPSNALFQFTFAGCDAEGLFFRPSHGGTEDPELIPNFPYLNDGDDVTVDVFIFRPPPGKTADSANRTYLGGVRGPFGSQTRLVPGRAGCE